MSEFRDETKNLVDLSRNAIRFYNNMTSLRVMGGRVHTADDVILGREWFIVNVSGNTTVNFQNASDVDFLFIFIKGDMNSFTIERVNSRASQNVTLNAYVDLFGIFITAEV